MDDLTKKRSSAKRNVTATANIVEPMLKTTGADAFLIYDEVSELIRKLQTYFDGFSVCHSNYVAKMEADSTKQEFDVLIDEQDAYFREVNTRYFKIKKAFKGYELLCKAHKEASEAIPNAETAFRHASREYNITVDEIDDITHSITEFDNIDQVKNIGAESSLTELCTNYKNVSHAHEELSILLQRTGLSNETISQKVSFDVNAVKTKYLNLTRNLSTIVQVQSRSNQLLASSTVMSSSGSASTAIKLAKADNVTFSGDSRDFATFKKDFETIVVPNRPPYEIGVRLRQAVPDKYKHLLANIELHDHVQMMDKLAAKFGTARQIVMNIMADLEKLKTPSDDKQFVSFVEKIEKAHRDLVSVNHLGEIMTNPTMCKIEEKFPDLIKNEWLKVILEEDLKNKTSKDKYEVMMDFLDKYKQMAEYQISSTETSKSSTKYCFVTGKTFHASLKPVQFDPCLACNVDGATDLEATCHNMATCDVWNSLTLAEKKAKVSCHKHPFSNHKTEDCEDEVICKKCNHNNHHFLLCHSKTTRSNKSFSRIASQDSKVLC